MRCGGVREMEVMEEAVVVREEVCLQLSGEGEEERDDTWGVVLNSTYHTWPSRGPIVYAA